MPNLSTFTRNGLWRVRRDWAIASILAGLCVSTPTKACGRDCDCILADGASYRFHAPAAVASGAWPVMLYFHGWQQTAADAMADQGLVKAVAATGSVFVAINGLGKTWTYPGSPSQARDDVAVTFAVLEDLARRLPIDRGLIWASGFSQGGSMSWWLACAAGDRLVAVVAFAGAFWEPLPRDCPSGPVSIMHVHGTADTVVPMGGRPLRGGQFRQGDVHAGIAVWRRVNACREEPLTEPSDDAGLSCRVWSSCASSRPIRLCLHPGGHHVDPQWIASGWAFVRESARRARAAGGAATINR
jgi:polyhydroxybutyrate depolymerase